MAVTAKGTPYVESSDLVANYPGVSLALANHIDDTAGQVLQVVSVTKVDTFTTTSTTYVDLTGLTATITPSSTGSKILVLTKTAINTNSANLCSLQLLRGGTAIGGGTPVGIRTSGMSSFQSVTSGTGDLAGNFLDSPASVSAQTYKIQCRISGGSVNINASTDDVDAASRTRTSSTITLMEIGA